MAFKSFMFIYMLVCSLFLNIQYGEAQLQYIEAEKMVNLARTFTPKSMQLAKPVIDNVMGFVLNQVFKHSNTSSNTTTNTTDLCRMALKKLTKNLTNAFAYFDASGKLPAGFVRGNLAWLGSFESCQDISDAHYCLININIKLELLKNKTLPLRLGVCLPSQCGTVDVYKFLGNISQLHQFIKSATFEYKGTTCPEKPNYTTGVILTLILCGILLLLCLLGTIVDVFEWNSCNYCSKAVHEPTSNTQIQSNDLENEETPIRASHRAYQKSATDMNAPLVSSLFLSPDTSTQTTPEPFLEFLRCFSVLRNTTKIFSTNVTPKMITSVNGIRVVSMFWIILGHTYLFMIASGILSNPLDMLNDASKVSMMVIINGYFSVDSFFFLSGLLLAYTCFRKLEKSEGRFNWLLFYIHRYLRLTPSLMFVILFYVTLAPFLAYSPQWTTVMKDKHCNKYWWTNLLYINNFYPTGFGEECIGWAWYLANDMQFFIISPLILILAHRGGWFGLFASAGSLFMGSTIVLAGIYGGYDIDPLADSKFNTNQNPFDASKADFNKMVYDKPYCRIQPYLVGMMLGYFIHKSYSGTRKPGWIVALVAWLAAFALGITVVYQPHSAVQEDGRHWTKAEKVFYGMFSRVAWSVALAWVVYACHYGLGGLVQKFLSATFWIPLSRLTYSAYLVHPIVLFFMYYGSPVNLYYSYTTITYNFITAVVLAYASAFILSVVIEFPCDNLKNFALNSSQKGKRTT